MRKIVISNVNVESNTIHYEVREDAGLGLLQREIVDLFVRFHGDDNFDYDLAKVPQSILLLPISLYIIPITYFYNVELVIPEMDKVLYERLPAIYSAYSKIYGPFKEEWKGKISVNKVVENSPVTIAKYDKIVFFSGGVDACHAGINNSGKNTLLVSIPDIERDAKNDGPLREEKFSLIKRFSKVVNSDWLLISNNFNATLFKDQEIKKHLSVDRGLCSPAFVFDGWAGIKYLANMCCVAPIAYLTGSKDLIMGSSFEQIEDNMQVNLDGANPDLTDSIGFADIVFAEQDGIVTRRSQKVRDIIEWCKSHGVKTKMWACFSDVPTQCGFCGKCVRTQLNILCAGENPREWGFDDFSENTFSQYIRKYRYRESNPCWLWDNIETIEDERFYPYCNELLHWLKAIGYKEYQRRAEKKAKQTMIKKLIYINRYPHYIKRLVTKLIGKR